MRFGLILAALLAPHAGCTEPTYREASGGDDASPGRGDDTAPGAEPCARALCLDAGPTGPEKLKADAQAPSPPDATAGNPPTEAARGDAQTPSTPLSDAGRQDPQTPGQPPSPGGLAPGSYVVHTRYYGVERNNSAISYAEEVIMLGRVARDAQTGQTTLHVQFCDGSAVSGTEGLKATGRITAFERYPARVYAVQVTGDQFQTSGPDALAGFGLRDAAACPAGTRVAAPAAQTWRSDGKCTCASDDAPPASSDDCRVTDSDGDQHPGFTVRWTGAVTRDAYAVRRDASRIIDGKISPDGRHTASYVWKHDHITLQCTSGSCTNPSGPAYRPCATSVVNPVRFAPLSDLAPSGAAWTCMEMLQQTPSLFPERALATPEEC